jgi:hypothetical protein
MSTVLQIGTNGKSLHIQGKKTPTKEITLSRLDVKKEKVGVKIILPDDTIKYYTFKGNVVMPGRISVNNCAKVLEECLPF